MSTILSKGPILFVLISLPIVVWSQKRTCDVGYVITNNGDTLHGNVCLYNQLGQESQVILTRKGLDRDFTVDNLQGFEIGCNRYFRGSISISHPQLTEAKDKIVNSPNQDLVFLKLVESGQHVELYSIDQPRTRYYVLVKAEDRPEQYQELIFWTPQDLYDQNPEYASEVKQSLEDSDPLDEAPKQFYYFGYRRFLADLMKVNDPYRALALSLPFDESAIKWAVAHLNGEELPMPDFNKNKRPGINVSMFAGAGIGLSRLRLDIASPGKGFSYSPVKPYINWMVGFELSKKLPLPVFIYRTSIAISSFNTGITKLYYPDSTYSLNNYHLSVASLQNQFLYRITKMSTLVGLYGGLSPGIEIVHYRTVLNTSSPITGSGNKSNNAGGTPISFSTNVLLDVRLHRFFTTLSIPVISSKAMISQLIKGSSLRYSFAIGYRFTNN